MTTGLRVFVIAISFLCYGITSATVSTIDYQLHSINDLREWPQFLLKGATRFKIDPHYVPPSLCHHNGEVSDPRGCLLLNHDLPLAQQPYNSTQDLLSMLTAIDAHLTIALCFKSAPDYCQNTSSFNDWLSLVDEFHAVATAFPNVEFILDGDAKPQNCLVGRWKPWNSVWIIHKSPDEAFYSNSVENDNYRFQILNNPENTTEWLSMAEVNYGKFSASEYPYQIWEPDAEADFEEYIDIYSAGESHVAGYHFAINIDIAMFWTYTGSSTGTATHTLLQNTSASSKNPHIVDVDGVFLHAYQQGSCVLYTTITFPYKQSASTLLDFADASIVALSSASGLVMIAYDNSDFMVYEVRSDENSAVSLSALVGSRFGVSDVLDAQLIFCDALPSSVACHGEVYIITVSTAQNALVLSYWSLQDTNSPLSSTVIATSEPAEHARIAISGADIMLFYTSSHQLYGGFVSDGSIWSHLGVGDDITVAVTNDVLMLVTDYGYCYNSHSHNTRSVPHVCSSVPKPLQHVLDYSIGLLEDWRDVLTSQELVSSCHSRILHGSYDQGSHPTVALRAIDNVYSFVSTHEAIASDEEADGRCGTPVLQDGIVVDSFPIDAWVQRLRE